MNKMNKLSNGRDLPPLRCSKYRCGRFAPTPENWHKTGVLVAFPVCTPCKKREDLRDKRRRNLARNLWRYG